MARWPDPVERVLSRVEIDTSGCWLWSGKLDRDGYAHVFFDGANRMAHRVVYEIVVGPIPAGLTLDHVRAWGCAHRHCVNPDHLEPVPHGVNTMRGSSFASANAAKTHCEQGHEFTPANTYMRPHRRGRDCRTCIRERALSYYWRRKAAA